MGKVEKVNVLYKNAIYGQTSKKYPFFFLPSALFFGACQFDTEKSHLGTWEHVQNGPKLKY